ncbi:MAG: O-acetyl-ADP-ribose deacetylase [Candidatus Eisenbacteria sp.]|nr:O-acetyl-ADP-ribose deacetylase [Candidatus Eisenbacteria bacterium]
MTTPPRIHDRIELLQGDITQIKADALVTAANAGLRGGGGVDGAIHGAGGPEILEECRRIGGCPTGKAVATTGGKLAARWVIHAVGPIWRGGGQEEAALLASAYRESLNLLVSLGGSSIAFPSISTGVYGYPLEEASVIALDTILRFLRREPRVTHVKMVLFGERTFHAYQRALKSLSE